MNKQATAKVKPNAMLLSLHRTFERDNDGKRSIVWYLCDGTTTNRLTAKQIPDFLQKLMPGTAIRLTAVNATDAQLFDLTKHGATLLYAHWHSLGINKGLEPQQIAEAFVKAPASLFREFVPREDIAQLRDALALRNAVKGFYNDAVRRIKQVGRNMGIADGADAEADALLRETFGELDEMSSAFKADSDTGRKISLDRKVEQLAMKIPECRLFNQIADIKGAWITAASVVAYAGGIDRFDSVAALWKYFGQHVCDGKAPKREKGKPSEWKPEARTAMYLMGDFIIKNRKNRWRAYFDAARASEMAVHMQKHPDCPTVEGHCTARARRKVCKEILKRFFVAATGQAFSSDRMGTETQKASVAETLAAR